MKFSFGWFKSKKEKEIEELNLEEAKLKSQIKIKALKQELDGSEQSTKPYKSLRLVNNVLTVIMNDGEVISRFGSDVETFEKIKNAKSDRDITMALYDKEKFEEKEQFEKEKDKKESVYQGFELLKSVDDFVVEGSSVYLKGIDRTIPPLLVEKFAEIVSVYQEPDEEYDYINIVLQDDEEYIALKRFFMWCCLNPRAEVADQLYGFLEKNGMKITKQGFFVALRNVVTVGGEDTKLTEFISNVYNKIKAVWKKKPSDFEVYKDESGYKFTGGSLDSLKGEYTGNLQKLYDDLPNLKGNRYTDQYTRTFDIRIGKAVDMKPEEASWSTADCAEKGLHFAGHTAPYVLCGDTSVFVLINPMKVVGIGSEKGRCYEYFPFMTTNVEEADEIMNSEDYDFLQMDEQYAIDELTSLEDKVKRGFVAEATKYEFNLPNISTASIRGIIDNLNDIRDEIKERVVPVE